MLTLLFNVYSFSQNLIIGKLNSENIPTLLTLNSNTGQILSNVEYVTDFGGDLPESITFNSQTNEIVLLDRLYQSKVVFKDIITNNETSVTLTENYEYQGVITENRLFVTSNNIIQEINRANGDVIETYSLNINGWNGNLIYSNTTKDIYGLGVEGIIFKFNIITNEETYLVLPAIPNGFGAYLDIIFAQNRLYAIRTTIASGYSLLEIDTENGSIINTYNFITPTENITNPQWSSTFLPDSQEICTIITGYQMPQEGIYEYKAKIIKYNLNTNVENSFDLPTLYHNYTNPYGGGLIVSTITEENLSSPEFNQEDKAKAIKAYNLLGQEIPIETYNQIIILKYDNGNHKKVYIPK